MNVGKKEGEEMKVILSRKGFDSASGGYPSPILPNGTLLSMPIPSMRYSKKCSPDSKGTKWKTWDNQEFNQLSYSDLSLPNSTKQFFEEKNMSLTTYRDVLNELLPKGIKKQGGEFFSKECDWTCHFDPDLIPSVLQRHKDWCSLFGQASGSERHLQKNNIKEGDLFLFFGWFRRTHLIDGNLKFDLSDKQGVHLIYGYMQIDYKFSKSINEEKAKSWMNYHPHFRNGLWNDEFNAVYAGRKTLSWDENEPGSGVFYFNPELVLTDLTSKNNPKRNRSIWRHELFPKNLEITYHNPKKWVEIETENGYRKYFQSTGRGQEFIISDSLKIFDWVESIIHKSKIIE